MLLAPLMEYETYFQVRDLARKFSDDVVRPIAESLDNEEKFPENIYHQMAEMGFFGIMVPESKGGAGLDAYAYALIMEELARGYASVADQCGLVELVCGLLEKHGTDQQQLRYLIPFMRAELVVAYCITEAEAGSDVSGIKTSAEKTPSGWELNGTKLWIHNAPLADVGIVLARTNPGTGHRGMSTFIVDLNNEGISRGKKEHKMGQRASQVGALYFDHVKLPKEALLGELDRGFYHVMGALDTGRVGIGALAVGIAQAGLNAVMDYLPQRSQFGRKLIDNQGIQWMVADMATEIEASRGLVHQAALQLDHGCPATAACSMAKCFATDMVVRQTANAVQLYGGSGYIRGFEVERLYRDAKVTQIYEGTNQIQRNIIARELMKSYVGKSV